MGWVESVIWWVWSDWIYENRSTDNSGINVVRYKLERLRKKLNDELEAKAGNGKQNEREV